MDIKEPGRPCESLEVQKQTDCAGMHKSPKDGMWFSKGGQSGEHVSSLAHRE